MKTEIHAAESNKYKREQMKEKTKKDIKEKKESEANFQLVWTTDHCGPQNFLAVHCRPHHNLFLWRNVMKMAFPRFGLTNENG